MNSKKVWLLSFAAILLLSTYPIYMGGVMLAAYLRDGGVSVTDYPKYIIPYTPICVALIVCILILPLLYKLKKVALPIISVLAVFLFLGTETAFEKVTVFSGTNDVIQNESNYDETVNVVGDSELYYFRVILTNESGETETRIIILPKNETDQTIETWQWTMCAMPPENFAELTLLRMAAESITDGEVIDVQKITKEQAEEPLDEEPLTDEVFTEQTLYKNPLITEYSPVFKIHFYAISLLIILTVIGVVFGIYKMAETSDYSRKKPLITQLVSVLVFIGLCIFACFTAFFRTGEIDLSPISAILQTAFFLVFGITGGTYCGTILYGKSKPLSLILPSVAASAVTMLMYVGEMVMMDGTLYKRGQGAFFSPIGALPLSLFDILVVILAGVITFLILTMIKEKAKGTQRK